MCRNIRVLFNFQPPATEAEVFASSLQYVRKVSGIQHPSAANREAFDRAVAEVAAITRRLVLSELRTASAPRDREVEKARAQARGRAREERWRRKPDATG